MTIIILVALGVIGALSIYSAHFTMREIKKSHQRLLQAKKEMSDLFNDMIKITPKDEGSK